MMVKYRFATSADVTLHGLLKRCGMGMLEWLPVDIQIFNISNHLGMSEKQSTAESLDLILVVYVHG